MVWKKYYRKIASLFDFRGRDVRRFLSELKNNLKIFHFENPDATEDDYINHFGEPKEVLVEFYENTNLDLLIKRVKIRKILIVLLVVMVMILLIRTIYFHMDYERAKYEYINREIITIEKLN